MDKKDLIQIEHGLYSGCTITLGTWTPAWREQLFSLCSTVIFRVNSCIDPLSSQCCTTNGSIDSRCFKILRSFRGTAADRGYNSTDLQHHLSVLMSSVVSTKLHLTLHEEQSILALRRGQNTFLPFLRRQ